MTTDAPSPEAAPGFGGHRDLILICAGLVLASLALRLDAAGHVVLPGLARYPLPVTCPTRSLLHMDCPGCGMTRSFVATAHGELRRAFAFHRLGPILFAFVLLQIPFHAWAWARRVPPDRLPGRRLRFVLPWLFVLGLLGNWVYNLITGAAFH